MTILFIDNKKGFHGVGLFYYIEKQRATICFFQSSITSDLSKRPWLSRLQQKKLLYSL